MAEHPKGGPEAATDHDLLVGIYEAVTAIKNIMIIFVVLTVIAVGLTIVGAMSTGT